MELTDILQSIEDNCSHSVITMNNPRLVWEDCKTCMYKGVRNACIDTYLVNLHCLKMHGDEKVMAFVNRIELENDLATVGQCLDEKEKKRTLPRGLKYEYKTTSKVVPAMDMSCC